MNRKLYRAALGLALATAAAGTMPVMAEGTTYTAVAGGKAVFEKYLVMDKSAEVPNATFNFTIKGDVTALNSDGSTTLQVYAGNKATGTPSVSSAKFKQGDTTNDTIQEQPTAPAGTVSVQNKDNGTAVNKDMVELGANQKYARHDVTVDFSGVTFNEPGVYRYVITETADANQGVTNDADATRVMDVYVVHDDTTKALKVEGYVLQNGEANGAVKADGSGTTGKSKGFTNTYTSHDLTISKAVTGNQASRDEYFKMTVKISNAVAGTVYKVAGAGETFDATTKTNGVNAGEPHTNPATLTVGTDGTVTEDFWLQGGQSIKIQGLADKTAYSINEDAALMNNEGYDPSAAISGDTKTGAEDAAKDIAMDTTTYTVADDAITADTTVAYTNHKNGTIPTGIIMSVAPYAAIVLLGGAGATIVMRKKKEEDAE